MFADNNPCNALTVPAVILPPKIAPLLLNVVIPTPAKLPNVINPLVPVNRREPALATFPKVPVFTENEASPEPMLSTTWFLKSVARSVPPFTLRMPLPLSAPVPATNVPPLIWVEPE
jgi:hypothetical protein